MKSPLTMTEYRPAGRLGLYVRAFQVFSAVHHDGASVLDFGGGDVSVPLCFGDRVLVDDWGAVEVPSAAVVGPRRHAVWLRFQAVVDQVNVSFFPGAASAFVDAAMPELVDKMATPDEVWPRDFQEAVADLEPQAMRDVGRVPDGVRDRQVVALRIEQIDRERLKLGEAGDELRDLVQQFIEVEHGRDFAAERKERRQLLVGAGRRRHAEGVSLLYNFSFTWT